MSTNVVNDSPGWARVGHGNNDRSGVPVIILFIDCVHSLLVVSDVSLIDFS